MCMETPGEMLSGYSSVSKPSASYFVRVTDQLCFAFFQYVIVFIGVMLAVFISGIGSVIVNLTLTALCGDSVLLRVIVLALIMSVFLTAMLAGFLKPKNSKILQCGFDDMCGLTVVEIGKPQHIGENQADE